MNTKVIAIVLGVLSFLALGVVGVIYAVVNGRSSMTEVAHQVSVGEEWREVEISPPLEIGKQRQEILLVIDGARYNVKTKQTFLAGGELIEPAAELRDASGRWYPLSGGSFGLSAAGPTGDLGTSPV